MVDTPCCQYSSDLLAESSSHCKTRKSISHVDSELNTDGGNHQCMIPIFSTYPSHLLAGEKAMDTVPKGDEGDISHHQGPSQLPWPADHRRPYPMAHQKKFALGEQRRALFNLVAQRVV